MRARAEAMMSDTESHTEQEPEQRTPGAAAPVEPDGEHPSEPRATPPPVEDDNPSDGDTAPKSFQQSIPGKGMDPGGTIEEELDKLVKTSAQRDEYLALAQRTQADFENYRKRIARDLAAAQERGVAKLAKELLPALDNLDRALEAAQDDDPLLAGVRLVRTELSAALARVGIEQFAPLGERFDPNEHEAMAQQPVDGAESGTVAEVFQNGYRLNGTIIRPARVLVAA
jgi:molecular chaperone GrpE